MGCLPIFLSSSPCKEKKKERLEDKPLSLCCGLSSNLSFFCAVAFQKKQFETFIHNMERDHPIWFLLVHFHLNYLVTGAYVICRERRWPPSVYASLLLRLIVGQHHSGPQLSPTLRPTTTNRTEQNNQSKTKKKKKRLLARKIGWTLIV